MNQLRNIYICIKQKIDVELISWLDECRGYILLAHYACLDQYLFIYLLVFSGVHFRAAIGVRIQK